MRRILFALLCAVGISVALSASPAVAQQPAGQQAYGQQWGSSYSTRDWNRFYHYPFVYYPQNFWSKEYYKSSDSMYYRYPPEMRVPVYNRQWMNFYPEGQLYHTGNHFLLDVF